MEKYLGSLCILFLSFTLSAQDLIITGIIDAPLTGGTPKAVELYVTADISDLSLYGIGSANNGGGTTVTPEFLLSGSATSGDFIYVASESANFTAWFGFAPDFTSGAVEVNGDDAIELFLSGVVIDVFGDVNTDGSGEVWEYLDGWAYRKDATGPDGSSFTATNWTFSGINVLDGETTNASAATPFPTGTYEVSDIEAPTWSAGFPYLDNYTSTSFDIFGQIDEPGTIFYVVILDGEGAPSSAEVVAGSAPGSVLFSGSFAVVTGLSTVSTTVSGLTDGVEYDVYVVAQDDEGTPNFQSTPVKLNFPEPIAITEFMNNPSVSETTDEWIELFNYGQDPVGITGWTISDNGSDDDAIGTVTINAGEYLILAKSKSDFETIWLGGTPNASVIELPGLTLANGADEIILSDPNGNVIWSIAYTDAGSNGQAAYLDYDEDSSIRFYTAIDREGVDGTGTLGYEDNGDASAVTLGGDTGSPLNGGYTQTLPVELLSFTGNAHSYSSTLKWQTSVEINNNGFEVEKSLNGRDFSKIGFVQGNGNSNDLIDYEYMDGSFYSSAFYRLRQVDFNGDFESSPIIFVENSWSVSSRVISPNPIVNSVELNIPNQSFRMLVMDLAGRVLINESVDRESAVQQILGLREGIYSITLLAGQNSMTEVVVKR